MYLLEIVNPEILIENYEIPIFELMIQIVKYLWNSKKEKLSALTYLNLLINGLKIELT